MTRDPSVVQQAVSNAVAASPAPVNVSDLDRDTRRAVARAAEVAGISEAEFWARTRTLAASSTADDAEARRIAAAARRR